MRSGVDEFAQESFSESDWAAFVNRLHYVSGSFTEHEDYALLQKTLIGLEGKSADRLYYLATSPRFFAEIVAQLGAAGPFTCAPAKRWPKKRQRSSFSLSARHT